MNLRHLFILVLFSIGIKIAYLLFSFGVEDTQREPYDQYISITKKNDAYWYEAIAERGYSEIRVKEEIGFSEGKNYKQSEWAFFPFYPGLIRGTSKITGFGFNGSALIWSVCFSITAIIGLYWFANVFFKDRLLALFSTLLVFSFPFSFYFSLFYTEALYFTFLIFSFLCIHYKRYFLLTLLLIPLTLLRPNGIVVLLPLYIYHLEQVGILEKFQLNWKAIFSGINIKQSLFFISAPLTFFLYCLYQYKMTGFYLAFSIAQDGWYREFMFPVLSFFRKGDVATQFNSVYAILFIVYAVWFRKKLPISLNILVLVSLLLPLCSGSVTSMTRFISVIFPLFLILATQIYRLKTKYLLLSSIFVLHFVSLYWWITNNPISY